MSRRKMMRLARSVAVVATVAVTTIGSTVLTGTAPAYAGGNCSLFCGVIELDPASNVSIGIFSNWDYPWDKTYPAGDPTPTVDHNIARTPWNRFWENEKSSLIWDYYKDGFNITGSDVDDGIHDDFTQAFRLDPGQVSTRYGIHFKDTDGFYVAGGACAQVDGKEIYRGPYYKKTDGAWSPYKVKAWRC
ncbi:hypothetical protein [Amycolatopsis sp. NPDC059021]|uniref:hypothetical protein n=1 Tax=Amycolatopsis sp. NPDC059021 TaxID=3346704 RepID=UPI003672EA23